MNIELLTLRNASQELDYRLRICQDASKFATPAKATATNKNARNLKKAHEAFKTALETCKKQGIGVHAGISAEALRSARADRSRRRYRRSLIAPRAEARCTRRLAIAIAVSDFITEAMPAWTVFPRRRFVRQYSLSPFLPEQQKVGLWRSWERASMAWKRSSVRSRPGPPKYLSSRAAPQSYLSNTICFRSHPSCFSCSRFAETISFSPQI